MHPWFDVLGLKIPAYGLMCVLAAIAGTGLVVLRCGKQYKISRDDGLHISLLAIVGGMVGAKVLYLLTILPALLRNWTAIISQPQQLYDILIGGFVFFGGAIGGLLAATWYIRKYRLPWGSITDLFAPAIPLAHAIGRIGCHLAGCCWGIACAAGSASNWGVIFTQSPAAPLGIRLVPVQLLEAGGNLLICLILLALERRNVLPGRRLALYGLLYGPLRFILEFFRGDDERGVWFLSLSQYISIALVLGCIIWLVISSKKALQTRSIL